MRNIIKLRIAIVLSIYLAAFTVDTMRADTLNDDRVLTIENNVIQLPYDMDARIRVINIKTGSLVMLVTNGYLDCNNLDKGKYILDIEGYKLITYTTGDKKQIELIEKPKKENINIDEILTLLSL